MVALSVDKLCAEADRDRAKAAWAILDAETDDLRKSLQAMNEAYNELQTRHRAALEEIEVLKQPVGKISTRSGGEQTQVRPCDYSPFVTYRNPDVFAR